jgi:hypothetical protein
MLLYAEFTRGAKDAGGKMQEARCRRQDAGCRMQN